MGTVALSDWIEKGSRRTFLGTLAACIASCKKNNKPTFEWLPPTAEVGHLLNSQNPRQAPHWKNDRTTHDLDTLIVGGGISGLSTAHHLLKRGVSDLLVVELEKKPGGNAASGYSKITQHGFPLAAHYLPVPGHNLPELQTWLQEIGIISGYRYQNPIIDPIHLCHAPEERLFCYGRWKQGIQPGGLDTRADLELKKMNSLFQELGERKNSAGHAVLRLPALQSDKKLAAELDQVSFAQYMSDLGIRHPISQFYLDYCMLDDYGVSYEKVSAFGGLHYFASRFNHKQDKGHQQVLTWPEGNGFLAQALTQPIQDKILCGHLCLGIDSLRNGYLLHILDTESKTLKKFRAKNLVFATPTQVTRKLLPHKWQDLLPQTNHAPWAVLQIRVHDYDLNGAGSPLSWDNVSLHGTSLGYVYAGHQKLDQYRSPDRHLSLYVPLSGLQKAGLKIGSLPRDRKFWLAYAKTELERMHRDVWSSVEYLGVSLWQHAMTFPGPGTFSKLQNLNSTQKPPGIHFAHCDFAGMSLFEEAFYQGFHVANSILREKELA